MRFPTLSLLIMTRGSLAALTPTVPSVPLELTPPEGERKSGAVKRAAEIPQRLARLTLTAVRADKRTAPCGNSVATYFVTRYAIAASSVREKKALTSILSQSPTGLEYP